MVMVMAIIKPVLKRTSALMRLAIQPMTDLVALMQMAMVGPMQTRIAVLTQ